MDQLTYKVIKKFIHAESNFIDVGCHKGEILDHVMRMAPKGNHIGFEPIPYLYQSLKKKYQHKAMIYPYALGSIKGESTFNLVVSNPAYSGLVKRSYDRPNEKDTSIIVKVEKLDDVIPIDMKIDMIKIDTEGGEYGVLIGGRSLIEKYKPTILFEHGIGGSDHYGTSPDMIFDFFESVNMKIYLLNDVLNGKENLGREAFNQQFYAKKNYFFIARP